MSTTPLTRRIFDGERSRDVQPCCQNNVKVRLVQEGAAFANLTEGTKTVSRSLHCADCGKQLWPIIESTP